MIREIYRNGGLDDVFQSLERKKIFGLGGSSGDSLLFQHIKNTLTEITAENLKGITKLIDFAFYGRTLTNVSIPDSVISIGSGAFRDTTITGTITLPNNLTSISPSTFNNCKGLTKSDITIPDKVTSIGAYAFYACSCNKLILGSGISSIDEYVFSNGNSSEVYYNGDLMSWFNINFLGPSANPMSRTSKFYLKNASGEYELLTELVIPDSITEIKPYAFQGCDEITSLTIHDKVTSIGAKAFVSISVGSITIPDSVTTIGEYAFHSSKITSVIVGRGVTNIDRFGLYCGYSNSSSHATFTFLCTTPPTIATKPFEAEYIDKIIVPKGCGDAYKTATNWANFADYIEEAAE